MSDVTLGDISPDPTKGADGVRRNGLGQYLVVPPKGKKPTGYQRMTTAVKVLDSTEALTVWQQGRPLLGVVRDPALLAELVALAPSPDDDPWYDTRKSEFKNLIGRAATAGGSDKASQIGTDYHALAAAWILDNSFVPPDIAGAQWLDWFIAVVTAAGLDIDREYVETIVVHDRLKIAGSADYLSCVVPGFELPLTVDLKTSSTIDFGMASWAIQIAGYATADAVYVQGDAADGSQDERRPMPDISRTHGAVLHVPSDGVVSPSVQIVDLVAGAEAFQLCLQVAAWRKRKDLASEYVVPAPAESEGPTIAELRPWLQERIDTIGKHLPARADFVRLWPSLNVALLSASDDHTEVDLALIESLCDRIEANHGMAFGPSRPHPATVERGRHRGARGLARAFPGSSAAG